MSVAVTLRVAINDAWRAGDTIQVYTDFGTGTIDMTKPLLALRMAAFPKARHVGGFLQQASGIGPYLGGGPPVAHVGGFLDQPFLGEADGFLRGKRYREVTVRVAETFGAWKFAAEIADAAGNVQTDALVPITHLVAGEDPPPVSTFAFSSYDNANDQVVFDVAL